MEPNVTSRNEQAACPPCWWEGCGHGPQARQAWPCPRGGPGRFGCSPVRGALTLSLLYRARTQLRVLPLLAPACRRVCRERQGREGPGSDGSCPQCPREAELVALRPREGQALPAVAQPMRRSRFLSWAAGAPSAMCITSLSVPWRPC